MSHSSWSGIEPWPNSNTGPFANLHHLVFINIVNALTVLKERGVRRLCVLARQKRSISSCRFKLFREWWEVVCICVFVLISIREKGTVNIMTSNTQERKWERIT